MDKCNVLVTDFVTTQCPILKIVVADYLPKSDLPVHIAFFSMTYLLWIFLTKDLIDNDMRMLSVLCLGPYKANL